jgi:hypothetical protein
VFSFEEEIMQFLLTIFAILALLILSPAVGAEALQEWRKFDANHDDRLSEAEVRVYLKTKLLKDFDGDDTNAAYLSRAGDLLEWAQREAGKGGVPLQAIAQTKPSKPDPCGVQNGMYLRSDRLDMLVARDTLSAADGASVSFTSDRLTKTQTAEINGIVGYLRREPCLKRPDGVGTFDAYLSGYALSPFLSAHGTLSSNPAKEKSDARLGFDAQFEIFSGPIFNAQYFTVSPYYQTDFRGVASAYGMMAVWEPYLLTARLGGRPGRLSPWLDFYWSAQAEVDIFRVKRAGLTDLTADTDYAWLGGTVRAYVYLLPEKLNRRLVLTGNYTHYWDERSGRDISLKWLKLSYNLDDDGMASLSFEYRKGTEKESMQERDRYVAKLNVKY